MRALALLFAALLCACAGNLTQPYEVKTPRLFAARIEVAGSSGKNARPKPGDNFLIRQYIALPKPLTGTDPSKHYSLKLLVCLGLKSPNGELLCFRTIDVSDVAKITTPSDSEIVIDGLTASLPGALGAGSTKVPSAGMSAAGVLDRAALFGAVCVDGKAETVAGKSIQKDPVTELFRCTDNANAEFPDALTFTLSVLLDLDRLGDTNRNPSFACDASEKGKDACRDGVVVKGDKKLVLSPEQEPLGQSIVLVRPLPKNASPDSQRVVELWPARTHSNGTPAAVAWTDCARADDILKVQAGSDKLGIRVRFDPADREKYAYMTERYSKEVSIDTREELLVSHAATHGKLERYFTVLTRDLSDDKAEIEVDYKPPAPDDKKDPVPSTGQLARFYFAVRDQRGGVDFVTRELCILPKTD